MLGACAALAGSAWAGTALINGVTYGSPVGVVPYSGGVITSDAVDPSVISQGGNIFISAANDGNLDIKLNIARIKGVFDLTGGNAGNSLGVASVPHSAADGSGAGYVFNAGWVVPKGEELVDNYSSGSDNSRCYVGMHLDPALGTSAYGGTGDYAIIGLEWNTSTNVWDVRTDNDGIWGGGANDATLQTYASPTYFQVRVTRDAAGNVQGEYAVDFGSFQNVPASFPNPLNLFGVGYGAVDGNADVPGWSWRGRVSHDFKASLTTSDSAIADTGVGVDTDGDGVLDQNDPWPNDGNYSLDSDNDGLPDSWETNYFGDLSQTATGNPDGDQLNNLQEFTAGTDPTTSNVPSVPYGAPATGVYGLLLLGAALSLLGGGIVAVKARS